MFLEILTNHHMIHLQESEMRTKRNYCKISTITPSDKNYGENLFTNDALLNMSTKKLPKKRGQTPTKISIYMTNPSTIHHIFHSKSTICRPRYTTKKRYNLRSSGAASWMSLWKLGSIDPMIRINCKWDIFWGVKQPHLYTNLWS